MICPKCGFSQPDDIYCALCGVNIEKYLRKRRKKRYTTCALLALVAIAAISIGRYVTSTRHIKTPAAPNVRCTETGSKETTCTFTGLKGHRVRPEAKSRLKKKKVDSYSAKPLTKPPPIADKLRSASESQPEQEADLPRRHDGKTLTAKEWFQKGRALDDDSPAEIECYEKAIELDPEFAPAHYCLGAIYCRQANYEQADQEFASFLKYASETDRQIYDIYVYYSLSDVERLCEKNSTKELPAEEAQGKTPTGGTEKEVETEEAEKEGQGLMSVVMFSTVESNIVVPVVLNGTTKANALVDTGAELTVLSSKLAEALELQPEADNLVTLRTVAGNMKAQLTRLDSIQIGNFNRSDFRVAIAALPGTERKRFDAILGMDFLSNYEIHIDNENNRLVLTLRKE